MMSSHTSHRQRHPGPRSVHSVASSTADKAPSASSKVASRPPSLPRRLLFPHLPPDADLPPLLVSPAASPELNAELYELLAVALRAYINPWWTKLTRYDKEFLPQITQILSTVLRNLESRVTSIDFSPFAYRDLPALLHQHYQDYRNAQGKVHTSYATGGVASLSQLFHQLQPHMAITAEGKVEEAYVRQLIDQVLKELLPTEDYDPEPERYIVREIILKVVLGSVMPRLSQPWFIYKVMLDLLGPETEGAAAKPTDDLAVPADTPKSRPPLQRQRSHHFSFQAMAILFLSAVRSISSLCLTLLHAYKQALDTIKKVNQSHNLSPVYSSFPADSTSPSRPLIPGSLVPLSPLPSSTTPPTLEPKVASRSSSNASIPTLPQAPTSASAPNYTYSGLRLLLTLLSSPPPPLTISLARQSYLTASALTHVISMVVSLLSPFLSRLLPYLLYTHVLCSTTLANTVRIARRSLFPEGWPAPPPLDPTPEEQAEIRQRLEKRLLDVIPGILQPLLGPNSDARSYTIQSILDPLSSQACNAHLLLLIMDLLVVTTFPDLGMSDPVSPAEADRSSTSSCMNVFI
ncbi:hypothetical protein K474DRAFT_844283 [Panus rudis PR-1116 ss-1]|nr:hypothetical protein K474DRAFT_844283 [Panus rudis PR-1116 ss-1]